jgi:hypothetical protein
MMVLSHTCLPLPACRLAGARLLACLGLPAEPLGAISDRHSSPPINITIYCCQSAPADGCLAPRSSATWPAALAATLRFHGTKKCPNLAQLARYDLVITTTQTAANNIELLG